MTNSTAVLFSAGLDSAVLAAAESRRSRVHPLYVETGLAWEAAEQAAMERLLAHRRFAGRVTPATRLTFTTVDLYPDTHWAVRGDPPAFDTPDEDVYLAGRNIMLLSKAAIHCARHGIPRISLAPLAGNPFPDATATFFTAMARALSLGLAHPLEIATPFLHMRKSDVIKLGLELGVPLALTLSCMSPTGDLHCGRCSKCRERRDAFRAAGVRDDTSYATTPAR